LEEEGHSSSDSGWLHQQDSASWCKNKQRFQEDLQWVGYKQWPVPSKGQKNVSNQPKKEESTGWENPTSI